MSVFTYTEDFGSAAETKPNVIEVKFGDGYTQRVSSGINTMLRTFNLKWANRPVSEIDAIEAFFRARAAVEAFDWTPARGSTAIKVVAKNWRRSLDHPTIDSITCTFTEVAEP